MGAAAGPNVVEDGLVLALDAGNPKNYNAGISTNWTDKVGGNNGTLDGGTYHTDGPFVDAGYVEFDGTGDYLSVADDASLQLGSGDFTIEFWIYLNSLSGNPTPIDKAYTGSGISGVGYLLQYSSSALKFYGGITLTSSTTDTTSVWIHYALVRNSGTTTLYRNGVSVASGSDNTNYTYNTSLGIGANILAGSGFGAEAGAINGYMSNIRIVKGQALYTSNFTPPTKQLTAITNTTLLTCQGNTIADASSSAHTITANGDAAANLGFPASAFEFDGVDDEITIPYTPNLAFTDAIFSCEAWVYADTLVDGGKGFSIINKRGNNSTQNNNRPYVFGVNGDGKVRWILDDATTICDTASGLIQTGQWYHLAATHDGTNAKIYVNGIENVSVASGTSSLNDTGDIPTRIGWRYQNSSINYSDGRIGEVRIYPRALTAAQVFQNYNATKGRYVN